MKKYLFILLALISLNAWAAVNSMHVSPESFSPDQELELKLEILQGGENLSRVNLLYRPLPQENWLTIRMQEEEPGFYLGIIPRGALGASAIQYRFEFVSEDGANEYLPDHRSLTPYFSLDSIGSFSAKSSAFIRLNEEDRIKSDDDYLLVVSFLEIADELDPRSIKVFVDNKDVTNRAQISGSTLLFRQSKPLPGIIIAYVSAKIKGKELYSEAWATEVLPGSSKPRRPFLYNGSVNVAANSYSTSDKDVSFGNSLSDLAAWSELYGSYGVLQLSSNLYFSSLEESNKQPVNRYNIGVKLPFLEVIGGDYSPNLSDFTLNGKNIRGVYSKLGARHLRLFWVHGESVRKTTAKPDPAGTIGSGSTFRQEAIGAKLSIGDENGFSFNLIASRHRDLKSSLTPDYYEVSRWLKDGEDAPADSTQYKLNAVDAAVAAVDLRINVPDQDVLMGVEIAGSLLNKNTLPGAFGQADLDEYGVDLPISPEDLADIFVINQNLEPFGLSAANLAWKVYLRSFMLNNMISVDYQEVGSSFTSLGSFSPLQDSRILSVSDQFNVGRYLLLSGSYNLTKDNLQGFNDINNRFQSITAQAIIRAPKLPHLKAAFSLDGAKNKKKDAADLPDFLPYEAERQSLNLGTGYNIVQIPYVPTQIDFSYRFGGDNRKQIVEDADDFTLSENKHNGFNISMINRFNMLPLKTYFSLNQGSQKNELDSTTRKNSHFYTKAEYSLFKEILRPYLTFSSSSLSGDQDAQNLSSFALGIMAYPWKNMTVTADYALQNYKNKSDNAKDYDNNTLRLQLSQRF